LTPLLLPKKITPKKQKPRPSKEMTEELNVKKPLMTIKKEEPPEMPIDKQFLI
jgi:hypothetical protein